MNRVQFQTAATPCLPACDSGVVDSQPLRRSEFTTIFSIGGVGLQLTSEDPADADSVIEMRRFVSPAARGDVKVELVRDHSLSTPSTTALFDSGATWKLYRENDEFIFEFFSPVLGTSPYKQMRADASFSRARIALRGGLRRQWRVSPMEYPVCELLITNHLAQRGLGAEAHGCGLIDPNGNAFLFLGHSGAGKSTTARLWSKFRSAEILSDDRMILRLQDGKLWIYGTPWHGESIFASPLGAKVEKIFILQHGCQNAFSLIPPALAVGEVFARCFPPFHSAVGLEHTIEFLKLAVESAPCYRFEFVPDPSSISAVLGFHD
jgi:hypothetical protein